MEDHWLTIDSQLATALSTLERELGVTFDANVAERILEDCQSNQVDAKQYSLYKSDKLSVTGDVDEYEPDDIRIQIHRTPGILRQAGI